MKAPIDFDEALYRRLKVEAARRGRTVQDLVAEGVRRVLDAAPTEAETASAAKGDLWEPEWYGTLVRYGKAVAHHSMQEVRKSVERARTKGTRS